MNQPGNVGDVSLIMTANMVENDRTADSEGKAAGGEYLLERKAEMSADQWMFG